MARRGTSPHSSHLGTIENLAPAHQPAPHFLSVVTRDADDQASVERKSGPTFKHVESDAEDARVQLEHGLLNVLLLVVALIVGAGLVAGFVEVASGIIAPYR